MGKYAKLVKKHGSIRKACVAIGMPRTTFRDNFTREKMEELATPTTFVSNGIHDAPPAPKMYTGILRGDAPSGDAHIETIPLSLPPMTTWAGVLERKRAGLPIVIPAKAPLVQVADPAYNDDSSLLKLRIKSLEDQLAYERGARTSLESLHEANLEPATWLAKPAIKGRLSLTPILFTSDFQVGETVRADEIDGLNSYNSDIFQQRYQDMIEKTISLAEKNTGATDFPGIVYLRGGDAINGEIHEELAQTNDLSAIPACRLLHKQERAGIKRLREKFGHVRVISLPGNHGRTTFKGHSKRYAERSYETMLSWWLASSFEDDANVKFWTPTSADAFFRVEGHNFLMSHGDKIGSRGGAGFVGPAATIARGHQKLYQNWSLTGQQIDCILTGHLHTSLKLSRGFANGSMVGYNEFARDIRADPAPASQWLLFSHKDHAVGHHFEIFLSDKPKRNVVDVSV